MTITPALQRFYASGSNGVFVEEGVSFFHPAFSQSWHLTNWAESDNPEVEFHAFTGIVRGERRRFLSHPLGIELPNQNVTGGQRLRINLRNSGDKMSTEIIAASKTPNIPIQVQADTFIIGNETPQDEPFTFSGQSVSFNASSVTIEAGVSDTINQAVIIQRYTGATNPALSR